MSGIDWQQLRDGLEAEALDGRIDAAALVASFPLAEAEELLEAAINDSSSMSGIDRAVSEAAILGVFNVADPSSLRVLMRANFDADARDDFQMCSQFTDWFRAAVGGSRPEHRDVLLERMREIAAGDWGPEAYGAADLVDWMFPGSFPDEFFAAVGTESARASRLGAADVRAATLSGSEWQRVWDVLETADLEGRIEAAEQLAAIPLAEAAELLEAAIGDSFSASGRDLEVSEAAVRGVFAVADPGSLPVLMRARADATDSGDVELCSLISDEFRAAVNSAGPGHKGFLVERMQDIAAGSGRQADSAAALLD